MISKWFKLVLLIASMLEVSTVGQAQSKNIIIEDDLAANSKMLKVKMGAQWMGKMYPFKFGDYAVIKSKMGFTKTKNNTNFWGTKSETSSENHFSFILSNKAADSAIVNCLTNVYINELRSSNVLSTEHFDFNIGQDELLMSKLLFTALIESTIEGTDDWKLAIDISRGTAVEINDGGLLISKGRRIEIVPASSNKFGTETRMTAALGYEFLENGKSLAAIQYWGGGMLGLNKNRVWLNEQLDDNMQLILAGAVTALLQLKN